jgi:hypothetical protein
MPSEILPTLLSCHKEFVLDIMRRRWPFGFKGQLEMAHDPVDGFRFFDKRDDLHLTSARRAHQGVELVDLQLFPEQQGEDLVGEKITDDVIMEEGDTVEGAIGSCTSFGHQNMDMRMEIDAISEGLNHHHHSRHELQACDCVQIFHKYTHCTETERIEKLSFKAEKQPKHFWNGEDNLTVRDIKKKFLPHPFAPFLSSLGMARRTEAACLTGKHKESLFPTVGTTDAGKATHRIATVEITRDHLLDYWTEISVILFKTVLIFLKKPLEIIKKQPIKNSVFRMTLAVDPWHSKKDDSRNGPGAKKSTKNPIHLGCFSHRLDCFGRDVIRC